MMIQIQDFPIYLKIGCYKYEKKAPSKVLLDLKCFYKFDPQQHDHLTQTIDYDQLLQAIIEFTESRLKPVNLLETLVSRLGSMICEKFTLLDSLEIKATKIELSTQLTRNSRISVSESFTKGPFDPDSIPIKT